MGVQWGYSEGTVGVQRVYNEGSMYPTLLSPKEEGIYFTVGKQTPCKLSFVNTSQLNLTVRTEPKFGKFLMPFLYVISNYNTYPIICGIHSRLLNCY